jgi:hypothetical protein
LVWVSEDTCGQNKEPAALYREVLAGQPDHSVTIISVGFSTNLARLLDSGSDSYSPLDGRALVAKKVRLLSGSVCQMARWSCGSLNIFQNKSNYLMGPRVPSSGQLGICHIDNGSNDKEKVPADTFSICRKIFAGADFIERPYQQSCHQNSADTY